MDGTNNNGIATIKELYSEAVERLQKLKANAYIVTEFKCGNRAYAHCPDQYLETIKRKIDKVQEKYGGLVYYCEVSGGVMANLFYVSKYKDEWGIDNEDLGSKSKTKTVFAYVFNLSMPELSEFGSIGVKTDKNGVMYRVW